MSERSRVEFVVVLVLVLLIVFVGVEEYRYGLRRGAKIAMNIDSNGTGYLSETVRASCDDDRLFTIDECARCH